MLNIEIKKTNISLVNIILAGLSMIISAKIIIPFYPVNFTMQPLMISLNVLFFGGANALIGLISYIVLGAIGMPVFTQGTGLVYLLSGVTTGFIVGMIVSTLIQSLNFANALIRHIVGVSLLYLCGITSWYIIGIDTSLILNYIPSEMLKVALFAGAIRSKNYLTK